MIQMRPLARSGSAAIASAGKTVPSDTTALSPFIFPLYQILKTKYVASSCAVNATSVTAANIATLLQPSSIPRRWSKRSCYQSMSSRYALALIFETRSHSFAYQDIPSCSFLRSSRASLPRPLPRNGLSRLWSEPFAARSWSSLALASMSPA